MRMNFSREFLQWSFRMRKEISQRHRESYRRSRMEKKTAGAEMVR